MWPVRVTAIETPGCGQPPSLFAQPAGPVYLFTVEGAGSRGKEEGTRLFLLGRGSWPAAPRAVPGTCPVALTVEPGPAWGESLSIILASEPRQRGLHRASGGHIALDDSSHEE